jgi:hypothetical protein
VFKSTIPEIVGLGYNIYIIDAQIPKNTDPKFNNNYIILNSSSYSFFTFVARIHTKISYSIATVDA